MFDNLRDKFYDVRDAIYDKLYLVKEKLRQRFFSKTYWASTILVVVGAIQPYYDFISPVLGRLGGKIGMLVAGIGVLMAILRERTKGALEDK